MRRPTLVLTNTGDQLYEPSKVAERTRPDFAYAESQRGVIDIVDQMAQHPVFFGVDSKA